MSPENRISVIRAVDRRLRRLVGLSLLLLRAQGGTWLVSTHLLVLFLHPISLLVME